MRLILMKTYLNITWTLEIYTKKRAIETPLFLAILPTKNKLSLITLNPGRPLVYTILNIIRVVGIKDI